MDNNNIQNVKKVLSTLFDTPVEKISEASSPDTIPAWDSMGHMNLIVALEEEFNIQLNEEQMMQMMDYNSIINTLSTIL